MLIAGICGLVAFAVYGQVAQSRNLDAQVSALTAQNSSLVLQISDRQREIADAQTVAWLEQEARQLGYIFPGEHLYVVVPPGAGTPASGGVSVPVPVFKVPAVATATPSPSARPDPDPDSDAKGDHRPNTDTHTDLPLSVRSAGSRRSRAVSSAGGVEQWKLVGLITRRSSVRIRPPQFLSPAHCLAV